VYRIDALLSLDLVDSVSSRYIDAMRSTSVLFERLAALVHQSVRDDAARHGLLPIHLQVLGYLAQAARQGLHALLATLQRHNGRRAFGVCRECVHLLVEGDGYRCGLTGEPLATAQASKICREWTAPRAA
jgi:hypothetical protein